MKSDSVLARLAASWGVTPAASDAAELASLQAELSEVKSAMEALATMTKEVEAQRDALAEKLGAIEKANAEAAEQAVAAKAKSRKDKLEAMLGTERAASVIQATAEMSDEGFEAVVAAMAVSSSAEAKSAMFNEMGVEANADAAAADAPSKEMQILRARYAQA